MLGRYDEPACKWKQDGLDHSVMLVGYGTTKDGKDYWTVRCSPAHADHHPLALVITVVVALLSAPPCIACCVVNSQSANCVSEV